MSDRRVPVQERSRRRYEQILDAAAEIFAEVGYDAATMESIAARAETSIGSVYQFFKNKLSVFEAVAERCLASTRSISMALEVEVGPEVVPWEQLLDTIVDAFAQFEETDSNFRAVSRNLHMYGVFAEADRALTEELIERTESVLSAYTKGLKRKKRRLAATMLVNSVTASLFFRRQSNDPIVLKGIIEETKLMLRRYLAPDVQGS